MATVNGVDYALAAAVAWSRATFPDRRPVAAGLHLQREAAELAEAIERGPSHATAEEVADVFILTAAIADRLGVDVAAAIWAKLELLKARTWGPPDGQDVVEHVRDSEVTP
jgi:NTP pyrophosphatase (non-canonical NTP hydrolase)